MEELAPNSSSGGNGEARPQRRRKKRRHGPFHLHHAQKKLLARAGVFVAVLSLIIIVWYWMAIR